MRLQAITVLAALAGCSTNTSSETPFAEANPLMAEEISRRVQEIQYQHRTELLDNLLWLSQAGEQAIPFVVKGLQHAEPKVRANSAWVLGRMGDRRAIPALQTAVHDQVPTVRLEVARSLVLMGDVKYAPILIEGLDSDRTVVRYNCHEALKAATGRDFGYDHLSDDPAVRQRAVLRWREWWGAQFKDPFFAEEYAQAHGLTLGQDPSAAPAAPMGETKAADPNPEGGTRPEPAPKTQPQKDGTPQGSGNGR